MLTKTTSPTNGLIWSPPTPAAASLMPSGPAQEPLWEGEGAPCFQCCKAIWICNVPTPRYNHPNPIPWLKHTSIAHTWEIALQKDSTLRDQDVYLCFCDITHGCDLCSGIGLFGLCCQRRADKKRPKHFQTLPFLYVSHLFFSRVCAETLGMKMWGLPGVHPHHPIPSPPLRTKPPPVARAWPSNLAPSPGVWHTLGPSSAPRTRVSGTDPAFVYRAKSLLSSQSALVRIRGAAPFLDRQTRL